MDEEDEVFSDSFIALNRTLESDFNVVDLNRMNMEPAALIVSRVVFALLISVSLVMNLLLVLAVFRRWHNVHVIYCLATAMIIPDLVRSEHNYDLIKW